MSVLTPTIASQNIPSQMDRDLAQDSSIQDFWKDVIKENENSPAPIFANFIMKNGKKVDVIIKIAYNSGVTDDSDKNALKKGFDKIVYFGAVVNKVCLGQFGVYYSENSQIVIEKAIETDINHRRNWIASGLISSLNKFCHLSGKTFSPTGNYTALGADLWNSRSKLTIAIKQDYDWKREYTQRTVSLLFGLSVNRCAFPGCGNRVIESETLFDYAQVSAQIAHIHDCVSGQQRSFKHGIPSKKFINSYENLILLCGHHHIVVDKQPNTYTADNIREWKKNHALMALKTMKSFLHPSLSLCQAGTVTYDIVSRDVSIKEIGSAVTKTDGKKHNLWQDFWFVGDDGAELGVRLMDPYLVGSKGTRFSIIGAAFGDGQFLPFQGFNHSTKQWVSMNDFVGSFSNSIPRKEFKLLAVVLFITIIICEIIKYLTDYPLSLVVIPMIIIFTIRHWIRHIRLWNALTKARKAIIIS